jgi:hypothetical protein
MMFASTSVDSSLLLWFLAAVVYWLAAHVALGALRDARREPTLSAMRRPLLVAGLALGTALCAGFVVSLSSLGLRLMLGFRVDAAFGLLLLSALCGVAIAAWVALRPGLSGWLAGGLALAVLATGVQAGWLAAAGFRPGLPWPGKYLAAASVLMAAGCAVALKLAFSEGAMQGRLRLRWRLAASILLALTWLAGQEVMIGGAALATQVGSLYQQQLTAPLLSLVAGTLVPLLLLLAALDQAQQRRQRRHLDRHRAAQGNSTPAAAVQQAPPAREHGTRRRRYRVREI